MKFEYRVRDGQGRIENGTLEADNRNILVQSLLKQGYYIISLKEVRQSGQDIDLDWGFNKVKLRDLIAFTRQLVTMMAAGLSILRCFNILSEQTANKKLKKAIAAIKDDIESGLPLWEAMAKYEDIFSRIYISMIRAGELGGVLEQVLGKLCDHLERENEINLKVKSASIYPAIISIFAVIMVLVIVTFIMPTYVSMFQQAGVDLPVPTQILITAGTFIRTRWMFILLGLCLLVFIIRKWSRTDSGRLFLDNLYIRLPVIGKTISRMAVARFARTMGVLVMSGIPILQSLEVVEDVVGNAVISGAIRKARSSITEGNSITKPLEETKAFEPMVTQMIAVGEETGALDDMLIRMSDYFDREVVHMIDSIVAFIEPVLIMLVAVLVGSVVVATLLPIFNMTQLVGS